MSNLTRNDIKSFLKVFTALVEMEKNNPDTILNLINSPKEPKINQTDFNKIKNFELYKEAKEKSKPELIQELKQFNVEELRFLIKELRLGSIKLKSIDGLTEYIADQAIKRTTDVFQNQ
jgi:hypothetical protein